MELKNLLGSTERWRAGEIGDAGYAGLYFLHWQSASHGKGFASRRCRSFSKPDPDAWYIETAEMDGEGVREYLLNYFERYQFLGVIPNVPAALAAWLKEDWPLTLCEYIPSSRKVLNMQVEGTRPVTLIASWPRMLSPVLAKANAFAFMVHDLEHAYKFFHDAELHGQQREFFRSLQDALNRGVFDEYLHDSLFSAKFDYLSSDMNTHPMHSSQYLRAILVEHHLRREGLGEQDRLSDKAEVEIAGLMASLLETGRPDAQERRMGKEIQAA